MKALVCDICGATIDKEGMYERYSLWMKDPQGEHSFWPKRMDICYDCLEKLKAEVRVAKLKKIISDDDPAEKFVSKVLGEPNARPVEFINGNSVGKPMMRLNDEWVPADIVEENGEIKVKPKRGRKKKDAEA